MYKFVEPNSSFEELESLLKDAEQVCVELNIPHRVLELCTGDLGFAAAKSYDVEMWGAGTQEWLEVSSCSNCHHNFFHGCVAGAFTNTINGALHLARACLYRS